MINIHTTESISSTKSGMLHSMLDAINGSSDLDFDFTLPADLEASEPPEARGLNRDDVRMMVSSIANNQLGHKRFRAISELLVPGDLLVINTSGTHNAALQAHNTKGMELVLHLSTHLPADLWVVEVRQPSGTSTQPFGSAQAGERLSLPRGASATLLTPYLSTNREHQEQGVRLWIATLQIPEPLEAYLKTSGEPIHYGYVKQSWPSSYYQTVYATEMGSAEMPSAGRAFTPEVLTALVAKGIQIAPLILHTGVSSLEAHEPPYEEYYRVPSQTAALVNATRKAGRRVIAVGTTVVRSLETVTDADGNTYPGEGWTSLVITPQRGTRAVNGLLTGFHEPQASHLAMLEAIAGRQHLQIAYKAALRERYLWHEFGDLHLILPWF